MIKYSIAFFLFCTFFLLLKSPAVAQSAWCQTQTAVWSDGVKQTLSGNVWFLGTCIQPQPADFCDQTGTNWTFYFNPTCAEIKFPCKYEEWLSGDPLCDSIIDGSNMTAPADCTWQQSNCDTSDRCQDASVGNLPGKTGAGGASGKNTDGVVLPGVCDLSHFDGTNGSTACVAGDWYKSCCQADGTVYPSNNTSYICQNGTCPNGSITPAGTIACIFPPPPPPSPTPTLYNFYFCDRTAGACQLTSNQYPPDHIACQAALRQYWGDKSDGICYNNDSSSQASCNTACKNECYPSGTTICNVPAAVCR